MAEFPYTQVTGKLKSFFEKIGQVGRPDSIDKKWLSSIGLTASNDSSIVPVLRFIGFVDQSNKPTEKWMSYRNKNQAKKIVALSIREGYKDLFDVYDNAHLRTDGELKAFFSTRTKAGAQVIAKTVTTFRVLCELADFDAETSDSQRASTPVVSSVGSDTIPTPSHHEKPSVRRRIEPQITFNIQVVLPENASVETYDNIFKSIATHLLRQDEE